MANTPINAMTATFGSGDQTAIKMNVADSGPSDSTSKLIDLQLGSVTKFKVLKRGEVIATNFTGSFSGSTFVKNQSSVAGTKYIIFSDGSGQRTLGYDTSLNYDASSNTLNTNGSVNIGGDIDSTNGSPLLLSSPTTIEFGGAATTIQIGTFSGGSYTRFNSRQVRGNFTGSFTGSFSGSRGNFTKLSGSNAKITGRVIATSFTGSISGSGASFNKFTVNSLTASISGALATFNKISGSSGLITGRLVATSFTGSISGGYAAFGNITGGYSSFTKVTGSSGKIQNNFVINGTLELNNAITGSNSMFITGAGSPIAGYIGILIGGTKYKLPLYPWT
jgi:hypothetical protein